MQTKNKREFPQHDKGTYTPTADVMANRRRPEASPLRPGARRSSTLTGSVQQRTGAPARPVRQEREAKASEMEVNKTVHICR